MRFTLFALGTALALPAAAQTALTPGHPDLAAAPPQTYTYDVRFPGDPPRVIGTATQTQTLAGDRLTTVSHLSIPMGGQEQHDSTVVAYPSLAPVYRFTRKSDEETETMAVDGGQIRGRLQLGNLDEPTEAALPAGAFGRGVRDQLVRSLPFADGYTATFRMADLRGEATTDTIRVTGQTPFTRADGTTTTAWTVEVVQPGNPTTTYAVEDGTRQILRMSFQPNPQMTIEMAEALPPPSGPVLRPGDAALTTSWQADSEARYVIRVVEPMQMEAGTMTERTTVADGVVTRVATVSVPMQGMEQTITATADLATLAPRTTRAEGGPMGYEVALSPSGATGSATREGATTPLEVAFDAPVFESAWLSDIAQSLPLAADYGAAIEVYDPQQGVQRAQFRVTGQEDVGGTAAWVVETVVGAQALTYYIDVATRDLVKTRMSPQPGVVIEMERQ